MSYGAHEGHAVSLAITTGENPYGGMLKQPLHTDGSAFSVQVWQMSLSGEPT